MQMGFFVDIEGSEISVQALGGVFGVEHLKEFHINYPEQNLQFID